MNKFIFFNIATIIFSLSLLNAQDYSVAPAKIAFNAEPGEMQVRNILVKNHSNRKVGILLEVKDYLVNRQGKTQYLEANSTRNTLANIITISPSYLEINPNEEKNAQVSLQAPLDDFTSKWGIITVSPAQEQQAFEADAEVTTGLNISGRIAIQISQTPPGARGNSKVLINNLREATEPSDSIRTFEVDINNVGDNIASCKVYLIAADIRTTEERTFSPLKFQAYPKTTRTLELKLPDVLSNGQYSLSAVLDYGASALEGTQIMIEVSQ